MRTNSPQQKMLRAESHAKKVKLIQIDLSKNVRVIDLNGPAAAAGDQDRIAAAAVDSAVAAAVEVAVAEAVVAAEAEAVAAAAEAAAAVVDVAVAAAAVIDANLVRSRNGHSYSRLALLTEYE